MCQSHCWKISQLYVGSACLPRPVPPIHLKEIKKKYVNFCVQLSLPAGRRVHIFSLTQRFTDSENYSSHPLCILWAKRPHWNPGGTVPENKLMIQCVSNKIRKWGGWEEQFFKSLFNSGKVVIPVLYLTAADASANPPWHERVHSISWDRSQWVTAAFQVLPFFRRFQMLSHICQEKMVGKGIFFF